ncbi:UNKNOWN [Stylonychia lemnae]|uniref:Uncharacterized protein n=1 Tax=Stylonychia lemnae TaxID=5949 RepID=A0A078A5X9_STYLE|nr:UNKNOWN [Stylonychia lemnae]|eukprot:CDW77599.1 UNKNOWN [Stylonychia lemnae]
MKEENCPPTVINLPIVVVLESTSSIESKVTQPCVKTLTKLDLEVLSIIIRLAVIIRLHLKQVIQTELNEGTRLNNDPGLDFTPLIYELSNQVDIAELVKQNKYFSSSNQLAYD